MFMLQPRLAWLAVSVLSITPAVASAQECPTGTPLPPTFGFGDLLPSHPPLGSGETHCDFGPRPGRLAPVNLVFEDDLEGAEWHWETWLTFSLSSPPSLPRDITVCFFPLMDWRCFLMEDRGSSAEFYADFSIFEEIIKETGDWSITARNHLQNATMLVETSVREAFPGASSPHPDNPGGPGFPPPPGVRFLGPGRVADPDVVVRLHVIPEPATLLLLATGLAGLAGVSRSRIRKPSEDERVSGTHAEKD